MKEALSTPAFGVDEYPRRDKKNGVGFASKTTLAGKLVGVPKGMNDRLMTMRLPRTQGMFATIVSAYAPTMRDKISSMTPPLET